MSKGKKKKNRPAQDTKPKETGSINTETEESGQMTQEEQNKNEADMTEETAAEETAEKEAQCEVNNEPEAEEAAQEAQPEEAAADSEETGESGEDARDYFKKKKEKAGKIDEKLADLTDKLQRQMAEFENYRKRTEKEKATMYDMGTRDTIEKLLPVIDNFERGLAGANEEDPFAEGMKMIYKQLMTMLTDLGVTPIDAAGKEFDPNLHNAVMHVDDENFGDNIVAEELQKGYMFKDHVVRHSMVKVAN